MEIALQSSRKEIVFSVDDIESVEYTCPGKELDPTSHHTEQSFPGGLQKYI